MPARQASVLCRGKLEALSEGNYPADCVFLVGPDPETAELFHACSTDLKIASEVFVAMLKDEWKKSAFNEPIRMEQIDPQIFQLLIEYTHVYEIFSYYGGMDLVDLAVAADHFLIQPLVQHCASLLKDYVRFGNVWSILNAAHHIPEIVSSCSDVLAKNTLRCIESPSFLQVSEEGIVPFLQMKKLNVESEMILVNACLKVANSREKDDAFDFMKAALPHLRLLLLKPNQVNMALSDYLTSEELSEIAKGIAFKKYSPALDTLSCNRNPRKYSSMSLEIDIIPEGILPVDPRKVITLDVFDSPNHESSKIVFHTINNIRLDGLEILTRAHRYPTYKFDEGSQRFEPKSDIYTENIRIYIDYRIKKTDPQVEICGDKIGGEMKFDSWFLHNFKSGIFVPSGVDCTIEVKTYAIPNATHSHLKIFDQCKVASNLESIKINSGEAFGKVNLYRVTGKKVDDGVRWERVTKQSSFILKKICLSLVE